MNLKKLLLSTLLIGFFLVGFSQEKKKVDLGDLWLNYSFFPQRAQSVTPMNDDKHYAILENGIFIEKYEFKTGKKTETIARSSEILNPETKKSIGKIDDFTFSNDEKFILISTETQNIYRRSSESYFWIYDKANKTTEAVFTEKVRLAEFSPNNNHIAFVYKNNLYIKDLKTKEIKQITKDGQDRHIINGTTDWVYEEEFSITKGFEWSPDGNKIAFFRFDESKVKEFNMLMWDNLYPTEHRFKYPKAGEDNSIVDVLTYDLKSEKVTKLETGSENDQYIPRFYWVPNSNTLTVMIMNRLQNHYKLIQYQHNGSNKKTIYSEDNKYWIDVPETFFTSDGQQMIFNSEKNGYNHIYIVNTSDGTQRQLTSGKWDIEHIIGVDDKNKKVYFSAWMETPLETVVAAVSFDGKTEILSKKRGSNSAIFSKKFAYYFITHSNTTTPPEVNLYDTKGKLVRSIVTNNDLKEKLKNYDISYPEFFTFKTKEDIELNAWMIKPSNFDKTKKYPVLMYVYGGPGSQTVENKWDRFNFFWYQILADKGYIIVSVDNRGTGGRGEEFKKCTYLQLGKYETEDQIEGAKHLSTLPYIDSERIGIWGWSYGGYMSTLCITKGADIFKTAIAVAPVTTWRYYDNIYTERFMRTPAENAKGYDDNSPINHVKKLKGNYMLIHGTADDNVHYQNAMMLADALVKSNKQFEMFMYPNRDHSIVGGITRYHLYVLLTDYIERKL
jgi:dipeptidyl-peptidase-4